MAFKGEDIVHLGASPTIDGLILVTDGGEISITGEHDFEEIHLKGVGVLELIDQQPPRPLLDPAANLGLGPKDIAREHQHVIEVHRAGGFLALLVALPDLGRGVPTGSRSRGRRSPTGWCRG